MARRHGWVLLILLALAPAAALAGPEDGGCQGGHCPHGDYSLLHYWFPEWYEARAHFGRYSLDQFPPGPSPSVPATYDRFRYKCPSIPATPTTPYADPDRYYGRPIAPPAMP